MKKRLVWPDLLKGILIITVILGHAISYVMVENRDNFMSSYLWLLIYSFHMPAFMAVSGYFAYKKNESTHPTKLYDGIKKRFHQLIIPFVAWSAMLYIVNHNVTNPVDYILYPNNSYWFLWALFFITSIFSIVQYLANKSKLKQDIFIILTALILISAQIILPNPKFLGYEYVSYYFIYYSMGYFIHKFNEYIPKKTAVLTALLIIWFILGSFWEQKGIPAIIPQCLHSIPMINIFYRILTATIFIVAMFGISFKFGTTVNSNNGSLRKQLLECGQISLGLYTVHKVLIVWLIKGVIAVTPNFPEYIHIAIVFILLTILSVIIVRQISNWKTLSHWLLGKK